MRPFTGVGWPRLPLSRVLASPSNSQNGTYDMFPVLPPSTSPDGLQCVLVKRLVSDLNFDTRVVVHPTIREPDGLAMSSRNRYLTAEERDSAPAVYAALEAVAAAHKSGERNVDELRRAARVVVSAQPKMQLEYISLADAATGREVDEAGRPSIPKGIELMASIAVRLGTTRLIDNIILTP